jgi:ribulose-5-phosphate 4-epimerase/fuculose-1-phosphate aldolase
MSTLHSLRAPTMSEAEHSARVDLAAAHRIAALFGWSNLIYNHITLRVPGESNHFLLKPNDLMFEEVTASCLVKLDLDGRPVTEHENLNVAGFTIHTAILKARPDINCVAHVHTNAGMAMSARKSGLLPFCQGAMRFYNRIGYHDYEGLSHQASEGERIVKDLGPHKAAILRNHGLHTCGVDVRETISMMKYLVDTCEGQLMLEASGGEIELPPPDVCEQGAQQWERHDAVGGQAVWPALLRMADRADPSFRD